jgi:hypothetical protein
MHPMVPSLFDTGKSASMMAKGDDFMPHSTVNTQKPSLLRHIRNWWAEYKKRFEPNDTEKKIIVQLEFFEYGLTRGELLSLIALPPAEIDDGIERLQLRGRVRVVQPYDVELVRLI